MKVCMDKQSFFILCFFVFANVDHAEIAVIMMIGGFSLNSGNCKRHTFTTSAHPSF